jgi:hypothetical protein
MATKKNGEEKRQWVPVAIVRSDSDPEKSFTIALNRDGRFGCSCPRWVFQRGPMADRKPCHHISRQQDVLDHLAAVQIQHELERALQLSLFQRA